MSTTVSRRLRWRADLLRFAAAGLRTFGDNATADAKDQQAASNDREAELDEAYDAARTALAAKADQIKAARLSAVRSAGSFDELYRAAQDALAEIQATPEALAVKAAAESLVNHRQSYRMHDEIAGLRRPGAGRAWTIDNFIEPSDEDLEGGVG